MELVIGGAYQGKRDYVAKHYPTALENICDGSSCEFEKVKEATMIDQFHLLVRRLMENDVNPMEFLQNEIKVNGSVVIISNELGCGLVPIEAFDRAYREMVGRLLCWLASEATTVTRVYCGIGQQIKP